MKNTRISILIVLILFTGAISFLHAQNWPNWRGPAGDGTSFETNLPVKWDSVTNVVWKTPVPGKGYSSPVVWNDRLFLTTAIQETSEKILLCFDSKTGKLLWQRTVLNSPFEAKHNDNSHASGTPATDGINVYLSFLDVKEVVVAAYDFSGNLVWMKRPGTFSSPHGYSCSPVLFEDKVIINANSLGDGFFAALNKSDGNTVWKVAQEKPAHSFTTPIIRKIGDRIQMISGGSREIASYNPANGMKYWFVSGPSEDFCSTPVYSARHNLVMMSSAWPQRVIYAIKPDGNGDVKNSHLVWQATKGAQYVPSSVCIDDYLFTTTTNGMVHCLEVATGNIIWTENLGIQYASPVLADGLVYMPNDNGVITIIKPGPKFEYVSKNPIGEKMFASPAISNGKIYLRGYRHLFCISRDGKM